MPFLIILGLIGAVAGYSWWSEKKASASPGGPPPNLPPTSPTATPWGTLSLPTAPPAGSSSYRGSATVTLIAGQTTASSGFHLGETINIAVPAGGRWTPQMPGWNPPADGVSPITWVYQGPGAVTFFWVAPDGSTQTTTMTFYTYS